MVRRKMPDFGGAKERAGEILNTLSEDYEFHNYDHTFSDVYPNAEKLADMEKISGDKRLVLRTAVVYHDTGHTRKYRGHEEASVTIAQEELPKFGYGDEQIERIGRVIDATRVYEDLKQRPGNEILRKIMCDSDLSNFGSDMFFVRTHQLMVELERLGMNWIEKGDVMGWLGSTYGFLKGHSYFTDSARELWNEKKKDNMKQLERILKRG